MYLLPFALVVWSCLPSDDVGERRFVWSDEQMRFLERLNTPWAFAAVLLIFLAVNGLLLYRYQTSLETPATNAPAPAERTESARLVTPETTGPEETRAEEESPPEEPTLQQALKDCDGEQRECVIQFVSDSAPEAEYVDERTITDAAGRERNLLYFSDPDLDLCEIERNEGQADEDSPVYEAVLAGEGSYDDQYADCLPEFQ